MRQRHPPEIPEPDTLPSGMVPGDLVIQWLAPSESNREWSEGLGWMAGKDSGHEQLLTVLRFLVAVSGQAPVPPAFYRP